MYIYICIYIIERETERQRDRETETSGHFVNKKWKIIYFFLGFKVIYQ